MNKIYKNSSIMILILAFIILQGCGSDFLETQPTDSVSKPDVFESAESARGVLVSVYRSWREYNNLYDGLTYLQLSSDAKGPDIQKKMQQYEQEITYSAFLPQGGAARYPWDLLYRSINRLNDLLANLDGVSGTQTEIDKVRGEALAMRGFSYFELVRRYQHTYAIASGMPGVPIYTEPTTAETLGNPRASVSEVYDQILSDLTQAASLMGTDRKQKGYFNINVLYAVLARVYLTMEDWPNAIKYGQLAKAGYPLMSGEAWKGGFIDINNPEWIWGQNNSAEENQGSMGANVLAPYALAVWMYASDTLVTLYSATDIRGQLIVLDKGLYNNFKVKKGDPQYSGDYPYIRSAEMYLIEAEAMAKSGNEPGAQDALYEVQHRADPNAVKSTSTGQALIDEIILEKRKEFWGEGVYFFDMLRNQMPLIRDLAHQAPLSFPANSWEFILPIPEIEFLINKSLDRTTDQNPLTGVFTGNEFN